jgi:hypothetical protein
VIHEASQRLIAAVSELDSISKTLVQVENAIEVAEPVYEDAIESFVADLWDECVREEKKFPPKDVRDAMAVKAMNQGCGTTTARSCGVVRRPSSG